MPLVFYTFSTLKSDDNYTPFLHIPTVKPIRQYNDVAAACIWSQDMLGLFVYIKTQLIDYQNTLQTAQCSTTIMQTHLKSCLLEFLCSIRSKLIVFRAIEELKNILDQIDRHANISSVPTTNNSIATNNDVSSIGFSHLFNNSSTIADDSSTSGRFHD
jgi:hypothetical protein